MTNKMRHNNRNTNKRANKVNQGIQQNIEETTSRGKDYDVSWFKPTAGQQIAMSNFVNPNVDAVILVGPAGTGKSTTAVAKSLTEIRKGNFKHIVFCKTPAEYGDDQIGFLKGGLEEDKLSVHFEVMRGIFLDFMDKARLKADEGRGIIKFTIPNFLAGTTLYDTILIIDESQSLSPNTMKLMLERLGEGSKAFILGDSKQLYTIKKREDGLKDLILKVTEEDEDGNRYSKEDLFSYTKLTSADNMRSRLSKRVTELYD